MLKSMTAYSRSVLVVPLGRFAVELQSVNRKFLEINAFLPKSLLRFDSDVKKWISSRISRGQITVRISVAFNQAAATRVTPNLLLAGQLKDAWDKIASHIEAGASAFSLDLLAREEGVILFEDEIEDESSTRDALNTLVCQALDQLMLMKEREGGALQDDISLRVEKLKKEIARIAEQAPGSITKYKERLLAKMQDALATLAIAEDDERLMKEVCLFADRVDIAEEITRFNSHLSQLEIILATEEGVGKKIEFLLQELNREINTISSKSADVSITRVVIDVKAELERIREQIQNVE